MIFFFGNDVVPSSWTLILPESWDESKTDFKGEVVFQDGGRDQCTSELPLKKCLLRRLCTALYSYVPLFSPLADELNASLMAGVTLRKVAIVIRSAKDSSIRS